jgi:tellurite resistance protein TerC
MTIALAGAIVLVAGVLMIVLPGPALLVIPLGIVLLATEFAWIRRRMRQARRSFLPNRTATKGGTAPGS